MVNFGSATKISLSFDLVPVIKDSDHKQEKLIYEKKSGHVRFGWSVEFQPMANGGSEKPTQDISDSNYEGVHPQI